MDREMPQIVIHLAARVGGIGANRQYPGIYFYQNLSMGIQLIEECRLRDVERFVAVGTICSYPKFPPVPFREEDFWNGYPEETERRLRLCQEDARRSVTGLSPGVWLRRSQSAAHKSIWAPTDNFDEQSSHVIPALIRRFVHAQELGSSEVEIWAQGMRRGNFLFVTDAARAIVLAMEQLDTSEPVNIGTGRKSRSGTWRCSWRKKSAITVRFASTSTSPTASHAGVWTSLARSTFSDFGPHVARGRARADHRLVSLAANGSRRTA